MLAGGLELFFHILGMSSSQLTNICQRGWKPPASDECWVNSEHMSIIYSMMGILNVLVCFLVSCLMGVCLNVTWFDDV